MHKEELNKAEIIHTDRELVSPRKYGTPSLVALFARFLCIPTIALV
jgi:hypothetical protein